MHGHPEIWIFGFTLTIRLGALSPLGKENWPEQTSEHYKRKPRQGETGGLGQGLHVKNLELAIIHLVQESEMWLINSL